MNYKLLAVATLAALSLSIGAYATVAARKPASLAGDDVGAIRRRALALYPVGTRVTEVASGLIDRGFRCSFGPEPAEVMTAVTLKCDSNDPRPAFGPRNVLDVVARNGKLTDIAVADALSFERADAAHPDPAADNGTTAREPPQGQARADAFDELSQDVMWPRPSRPGAPVEPRPLPSRP